MTDKITNSADDGQTAVQPVNVHLLDDLPVEADAFGGHQRVATAIAELITKEDGGKAIALEGGWGSGKSSVVRMLEKELDQQNTKLLVFDAWSHEGDPLRRVFLEELTSVCSNAFDSKTKEKWENRKKREITGRQRETLQRTTPVLSSRWPILVISGAALYPVAVVALGGLLRHDTSWWVFALIVACTVIALGPAAWLLWLFWQCKGETNKQLARAGRLISLWSKKIDETTATTAHENVGPTSIEFQSYFSDIVQDYLADPLRRLVIVLDNLDRVPASTARTLWSTLRLFADCCENNEEQWSKRAWFIVPYDRASAATLWEEDTKSGDDEHATKIPQSVKGRIVAKAPSISAAFLDKAFQIRFGVPPLHIADWEEYLKALLEKAMPGIGEVAERHRVYRLSERLADNKGRPPSPRHLKLYVNDIGALVRQFPKPFPLDHLALYALLQRQDRDIRLWVLSGAFKKDPLAHVMPDETFVESLLAIYFGTDVTERAKTLTLSAPLRSSLRNGDDEQVKQLSQVPGFWSVAQSELEKPLEDEDVKQEVVVNLAKALDASGLDAVAPPEYAGVIPAFARQLLEGASWTQLNDDSAHAAERLLQIANDRAVTKATFAKLVSGEPDAASVATEPEAWASGAAHLIEVASKLGHARDISIPGDAAQVVKCLAAIGDTEFPTDVLQSLRCECPPDELQTAIAPTAAEEWPAQQAAALRVLLSAPEIKINWGELVAPISARLQVAEIAHPECNRLMEALFNLHDRVQTEVNVALVEIVKHASYYVHVNAYSKDADAIARLLAALVLAKQVGRAPTGEPEKKGYEFLQSLFAAPDENRKILDAFLSLLMKRPELPLLNNIIDQRAALGNLAVTVLSELAEREDVGNVLTASLFIEKFAILKELVAEKVDLLATNALKSEPFRSQLRGNDVQIDQAAAHCTLVTAGALHDTGYRDKLFESLGGVDNSVWEKEICKPANLYKLLVLALKNGFDATSHLADAVEEVGKQLCGDNPPEVKWSEPPPEWATLYNALADDRRGTAAYRIVDQLVNHGMPKGLRLAIALFGVDLTSAFATRSNESLVRRIVDPIVKEGDQTLIAWLVAVVQTGQTFWEAAPPADKNTFAETLRQRLSGEQNDEVKQLLHKVAELLGLEPEAESADQNQGDGKGSD